MVSNKKRLYVALYPSGVVGNEERRYHWAFLIGPKKEVNKAEPGMRYHVNNTSRGRWEYEEKRLQNVRSTASLLVRILIGKITDEERLRQILRENPVVQNDPNWRCRTWMAQALRAIEEDGKCVGTAVLDWHQIEPTARDYAAAKASAGRFDSGVDMTEPKPTWDILESRETVL